MARPLADSQCPAARAHCAERPAIQGARSHLRPSGQRGRFRETELRERGRLGCGDLLNPRLLSREFPASGWCTGQACGRE